MSEAAFSTWFTGRREPNFKTAMKISAFFEVPPDRLATADFGDLLANELADQERYSRVETKIHRHGEQLRVVS